jgi:hypothetical protein
VSVRRLCSRASANVRITKFEKDHGSEQVLSHRATVSRSRFEMPEMMLRAPCRATSRCMSESLSRNVSDRGAPALCICLRTRAMRMRSSDPLRSTYASLLLTTAQVRQMWLLARILIAHLANFPTDFVILHRLQCHVSAPASSSGIARFMFATQRMMVS